MDHTELRDAIIKTLRQCNGAASLEMCRRQADALVAGPLARLLAGLADPVRRRREAVGAWVEANPVEAAMQNRAWHYRQNALAAGESAVSEGGEQ